MIESIVLEFLWTDMRTLVAKHSRVSPSVLLDGPQGLRDVDCLCGRIALKKSND